MLDYRSNQRHLYPEREREREREKERQRGREGEGERGREGERERERDKERERQRENRMVEVIERLSLQLDLPKRKHEKIKGNYVFLFSSS